MLRLARASRRQIGCPRGTKRENDRSRVRRKCCSVVAVGRPAARRRVATRSDQLSSKLTVFMGVELDEADCGQLSLIPYFEGADRQTLRYRPTWRRKRRCLSTSGAPAAIGTNSQVKALRNGEVINERSLLCDPVIVAFQNDIVISVSFGRYAKVIYGYFLMRNGLH